jgi:hypothetical protein
VARESSQPHVEAWGSSRPHVEARESSQPHVVARGSSQPHVVAWGSSQPHVVAWGSSQAEFNASGYVQASLFGLVVGTVSAGVSVLIRGTKAKIEGGKQTKYQIRTAEAWCDYYGIPVVDGVATLYKALHEDFRSPHDFSYRPGTSPEADDWDGGQEECGGGLHFSPSPIAAAEFLADARRFVACPVALADMRPPADDDDYPQKVKARRVCGPIIEVDRYGRPVTSEASRV